MDNEDVSDITRVVKKKVKIYLRKLTFKCIAVIAANCDVKK